jgi:hypothetical protein
MPYQQAAQRSEALAQLLMGVPDAISKRTWRKKKTRGPTDVTGLASTGIARRDLEAEEKAERM